MTSLAKTSRFLRVPSALCLPSRRNFHNYFVSHLPSASLFPDSRSTAGPSAPNRDLTVVRIPLRSAKHHFGVAVSRGQRIQNEDTNQAGTITMPAFAKRPPISLVRGQDAAAAAKAAGIGTTAASALGDPQVFYFAVFDGHGGTECSDFLRDELHGYIEQAAADLQLQSSLQKKDDPKKLPSSLQDPSTLSSPTILPQHDHEVPPSESSTPRPLRLQSDLLQEYRRTIGGYWRRFRPSCFTIPPIPSSRDPNPPPPLTSQGPITLETVLTYAFLRADLDFVTAQARDTRVLLCETKTGLAVPLTADHRPSSPTESRRLRRYLSDSLVTDSFGEERLHGLANSRSFGDMGSKRIGVSAEPDIVRVDLHPAQYSFMVLCSDGVSGTLSDQEIVDIVKEAGTPEEGARSVVEYATEVSSDGDNATCLVVRLGGWERRCEGGLGSMGTKEVREMRRVEAEDPRRRGR
ncbi:uncharacterized protein CTHT_0006930 [Thermochaetoides thermophila DSM 1495]|uniref:PPM-type phosphatase domain-containing protein n=1 Tax=Chaetomium thermophilum (strain DSM 1495 / CBS 144.50 / IMI 039719) TaxID=759272 RepID=G0RYJ6_CHATD|nr:hypothetical protein CTHT_0006930 [Thermochaetoides thermophila DSM 1495]EGS23982.1 hypothetical protein CTHT_0006930 [Thermochaetoides thermophila DSM 1495]